MGAWDGTAHAEQRNTTVQMVAFEFVIGFKVKGCCCRVSSCNTELLSLWYQSREVKGCCFSHSLASYACVVVCYVYVCTSNHDVDFT